jgi:hypothetical protein
MKTRIIIPLLILMSCGGNGSGNRKKAGNEYYTNDTFVLKDKFIIGKYLESSDRIMLIQRLDNPDLIAELRVSKEDYWGRNVGDTFTLTRVEKSKFFTIK